MRFFFFFLYSLCAYECTTYLILISKSFVLYVVQLWVPIANIINTDQHIYSISHFYFQNWQKIGNEQSKCTIKMSLFNFGCIFIHRFNFGSLILNKFNFKTMLNGIFFNTSWYNEFVYLPIRNKMHVKLIGMKWFDLLFEKTEMHLSYKINNSLISTIYKA